MPSAEKTGQDAHRRKPWWLGLALAVMGALWLNGARSIASTTNYIGLGPAAIVLAVGIGLTILGILLMLQALRGEFGAVDDEAEAPPSRPAFLFALAGVAVPLLTMRSLGFPLTAMLAFALVTHGFGSRRTVLDLAIGFALGSAAWLGFSRLGISLGGFLPLIG